MTAAIAANCDPRTAMIAMLTVAPHADSVDPRISAVPGDDDERERRAGQNSLRWRTSGRATMTRPMRRREGDPDRRDQHGRLAGRDEPDPEDDRRRQDRRTACACIGRRASVRPADAASGASAASSMSPDRHVRPRGFDRRQDDADGDDASSTAATRPIVSPSATAISAATAPSVATIGATMETLPKVRADTRRTARPSSRGRRRAGGPARPGGMSVGTPVTRAIGSPTMVPTIITQASTTRDPIIRLDREEARVADAHRTAAPRPPMIAVTRSSLRSGRSGAGGRPVVPSRFAPGAHPVPRCPSDRPSLERGSPLWPRRPAPGPARAHRRVSSAFARLRDATRSWARAAPPRRPMSPRP